MKAKRDGIVQRRNDTADGGGVGGVAKAESQRRTELILWMWMRRTDCSDYAELKLRGAEGKTERL